MRPFRFILHPSSFILCLLLALPVFAEFSGLPDGVNANLSAIRKYPKASLILLWVRDSYTQNENGEHVYERHEFRYLPDEAARDTWGDPRIAYVDGRQKVDVIAARAYTSDGRTVDVTSAALNSVTPDELGHAPDFSDFRQMVVTLLGLENGSIAELHYTITTEQWLFPRLSGRVYFREEVPTIFRELSVSIPTRNPRIVYTLTYRGEHGMPEPVITDSTTYTWRMGEQPGYDAADLDGHRELLPNVAFSTDERWSDVLAVLKRQIESISDSIALPQSLQKRLVGVHYAEAKLDSIKAWVRERFNEVKFDHPAFELTLRPVSRVLASGYGNSLEMALLVATLIAKSNTDEARTDVWLTGWCEMEPPVPYLDDVTGWLLTVMPQVGTVFTCHPVLPRDEFPQASLFTATLFTLSEYDSQKREWDGMRNGTLRINLNIDALDADSLRGSGTLLAYTNLTPYEALRTDAQVYLQQLIALKGVAIEKVVIKQLVLYDATVNFKFTAAAPDTVDGHHIFALDVMDFAQFAGNPTLSIERMEFPHYVKLPGAISVHVEAPLPEGWTVTQQPAALNRAWRDGSGTRTVLVKDGRVVMDERLVLGSAWIPPQDWSEFRSFLLETGPRANNTVVFAAPDAQ